MIHLEDVKPDIGCLLLLGGTPTKPIPVKTARALFNLLREYNDSNGRLQQEVRVAKEIQALECARVARVLQTILTEKNRKKLCAAKREALTVIAQYIDTDFE
jgi:hypothetical protein